MQMNISEDCTVICIRTYAILYARLHEGLSMMISTLLGWCSGAQKLQSFNLATGGPVMSLMAPKMDTFLGHIKDLTGFVVPLEKVLSEGIFRRGHAAD